MCQVSMFVRDGEEEVMIKENITKLEFVADRLRVSTLFEGAEELADMSLQQIDFSAGRVVLEKIKER